MPTAKKRASKRTTTDSPRYGGARAVTGACPETDCLAVFAADTEEDLSAGIADHVENAHSKRKPAKKKAK